MLQPKDINVIIACEESQTVCKAFRDLGFNAFSCDIQECSGGMPEFHLKMDALQALKLKEWDLLIAHPVCKFISNAGARWMFLTAGNLDKERFEKGVKAKDFFMSFLNSDIKFIAVENPTPLKVLDMPKHTQVIQPYQFGHPHSKRTLLWLKNLPQLKSTNVLDVFTPYLPSNTGGKKRGHKATFVNISEKESSKTFEGIAKAMANQWGDFLLKNINR